VRARVQSVTAAGVRLEELQRQLLLSAATTLNTKTNPCDTILIFFFLGGGGVDGKI